MGSLKLRPDAGECPMLGPGARLVTSVADGKAVAVTAIGKSDWRRPSTKRRSASVSQSRDKYAPDPNEVLHTYGGWVIGVS